MMIQLILGLAGFPLLQPAGGEGAQQLALRAERVHVGGGEVVEGGTVVLDGEGRIASVLASGESPPEGVPVVELEGELSAGMIAMQDTAALGSENLDETRRMLADARLAHAYDPGHEDFGRLLSQGVTAVVLAPPAEATERALPAQFAGFRFGRFRGSSIPVPISGGRTALVKTAAGGRVASDAAQLHLALCEAALEEGSYPTSYSGLIEEVERLLAASDGPFAGAKSGGERLAIHVGERHELQRALALAQRHGLRGHFVGCERAGELAAEVAASGMGVVLPPFDPGASFRWTRSAVELTEAGVPLGFALGSPARHPAALRLGAAACVRAGVEPARAWDALTADAARMCGAEDRLGRIAPGHDADLVLWSGPPLDLASRVEAVWVDGEKVHGGER